MEEQKAPKQTQQIQTTLDNFEYAEDVDSEYGHLVSHLIEQDIQPKDTSKWTRVFSTGIPDGVKVPIYPLGPDLIYDNSLRDSMGELTELKGEVVFSPYMFKAKDMVTDLAHNQLSLEDLIGYGKTATLAKTRFIIAESKLPSKNSSEL